MRTLMLHLCAVFVAGTLTASASAQPATGVAPDDANAIQALVGSYARALGSCDAEGFADLFAPGTGTFASGFRGEMVGREQLILLVQSERHCTAPTDSTAAPRPGGTAPHAELQATATGARGIVDLGRIGEYEDEYVKTAKGWKFASRTVLLAAEKAAGLDASEMRAIRRLGNAKLGDHYVDQNGVKRLLVSGVAIRVVDGAVTGRAYLQDGGYDDAVYEKLAPGEWRVKSLTHVSAAEARAREADEQAKGKN